MDQLKREQIAKQRELHVEVGQSIATMESKIAELDEMMPGREGANAVMNSLAKDLTEVNQLFNEMDVYANETRENQNWSSSGAYQSRSQALNEAGQKLRSSMEDLDDVSTNASLKKQLEDGVYDSDFDDFAQERANMHSMAMDDEDPFARDDAQTVIRSNSRSSDVGNLEDFDEFESDHLPSLNDDSGSLESDIMKELDKRRKNQGNARNL